MNSSKNGQREWEGDNIYLFFQFTCSSHNTTVVSMIEATKSFDSLSNSMLFSNLSLFPANGGGSSSSLP
ncbi:unnamed protein product [Cuscuta campestris]|uniref:Uncharacterized protein n=1 Tax=Cuscuta campestris TaxID=132261 RepID=A0A484L9B2_9ASTE|nr:unnamed protein product [Cuscuta campestris]